MFSTESVRRVAIVGTGTIGASWAAHYLARGFDVTATDPADGANGGLTDRSTMTEMLGIEPAVSRTTSTAEITPAGYVSARCCSRQRRRRSVMIRSP